MIRRAIVHYSYDDLHHYLAKLNRYTTARPRASTRTARPHTWQAMLAHFVTTGRSTTI